MSDNYVVGIDDFVSDVKVEKTIHKLALAIKTNQLDAARKIFYTYINNEVSKKTIYECFHNPEMIYDDSARSIRNVVYEYLAHIPIKASKSVCKLFELRYNYCVFKYAMNAGNIPLLKWFAFKGYPRRIKKGNTEVYFILSSLLNIQDPKVPEDLFIKIVSNIFKTYKGAKISMYSFLNLLENGYNEVAHLFETKIDPDLFTGVALDEKIRESKKKPDTFAYLKKIGLYELYGESRLERINSAWKEAKPDVYIFKQSKSESSLTRLEKLMI